MAPTGQQRTKNVRFQSPLIRQRGRGARTSLPGQGRRERKRRKIQGQKNLKVQKLKLANKNNKTGGSSVGVFGPVIDKKTENITYNITIKGPIHCMHLGYSESEKSQMNTLGQTLSIQRAEGVSPANNSSGNDDILRFASISSQQILDINQCLDAISDCQRLVGGVFSMVRGEEWRLVKKRLQQQSIQIRFAKSCIEQLPVVLPTLKNMESSGLIKQLLNILDLAHGQSLEMFLHATNLQKIIQGVPLNQINSMLYISTSIMECLRVAIESTTDHLYDLQTRVDPFLGQRNVHQKTEVSLLDQRDIEALVELKTSRCVSMLLYHQLSQICTTHSTHKVFFNLDSQNMIQNESPELSFCFAFKPTDSNEYGPVWIKAYFKSNRLEVNMDTLIESEDAMIEPFSLQEMEVSSTMCPANMTHNIPIEWLAGTSRLEYLTPPRYEDKSLPLSIWIKQKYRDRDIRIKLSRLIAEAVLKFNPVFWSETWLCSQHIMVVNPPNYKGVDSHISITLQNNHNSRDSSCTRLVLHSLGVTLLELAYANNIPRPDYKDGTFDSNNIHAIRIMEMCQSADLEKQLGEGFAKVVRFCISDHDFAGNMYDPQVQYHIYQKVVLALKVEESIYRNIGFF